jgi:hypothetical protein
MFYVLYKVCNTTLRLGTSQVAAVLPAVALPNRKSGFLENLTW